MRITILLLLFAISFKAGSQTKQFSEKINFDYKSKALNSKNIKQIRNLWEHIPLNSTAELHLVSSKEIKKLNPDKLATLSKARADAIKLLLTTQKIVNTNDIELNTHSFTEVESIYGTSASFNTIMKDPYKIYSLVLSKEVPNCFDFTTSERTALASKEPNKFIINTAQDAMIKGENGIVVLIPAHSFILPEGKYNADVTIKLWEFIRMEDIINANLFTTSAGRLLETGGMIFISADCEGTCLKLLRSSKIIIKFPTTESLDNMRLFKGVPLPQIIDWKPTDNLNSAQPTVLQDGDGGSDSLAMNYYILESSGLGWINCDRFSEVEEKTDVTFTYPGNFNGTIGLVFTEINSFMPGDFIPIKKDNIKFHNVPTGSEATLLLYSVSKDKKSVSYARNKVTIGKTLVEEIKLSEISLEEFKIILKNIRN